MQQLLFSLFLCSFLYAQIQIVSVDEAEAPSSGQLMIRQPGEGQVFEKQPILIEVEVEDFPLGVPTDTKKEDILSHSSSGQSLHIIIDNHKPFKYRGLAHNLLGADDDENFIYRFNIPYGLEEGEHILRIFPTTSYGEAIKDASFFKTTFFYVKKEKPMQPVQLNKPFLTYNEPSGSYKLIEGQPLLLDFFVSNCELSKNGCKVILRIDDQFQKKLFQPPPYLMYGLGKRKHKIELILVGPDGKVMEGEYNHVVRHINIE